VRPEGSGWGRGTAQRRKGGESDLSFFVKETDREEVVIKRSKKLGKIATIPSHKASTGRGEERKDGEY